MTEPIARPRTRTGKTSKVVVGQLEFYMTVNLTDKGKPMELFIDSAKEGTVIRGLLGTISRLVSHQLQHGTAVKDIVDAMLDMTFEPNGETNDPELPRCKSISDYVARRLALDFLPEGELDKLSPTHTPANVQVSPSL